MRNRFRKPILLISLIWLASQMGCLPQAELQNIVLSEDVIYISGEIVRLTGRVIETDGSVDDHGFYIDTDPEFPSPITITLGPKAGLGRFIGEYEFLKTSTPYYFRSFANINGTEVTGQIKEFISLKPSIYSFYPMDGVGGTLLTIRGTNFTHDTRVSINGKEVDVISITGEAELEVRVPPLVDVVDVAVEVTVQDTLMVFADSFSYHFGHWELETTFPDNLQLYECMFFRDGDQFIFGMGSDSRFNLNLNVWSLDLVNNTWSDLNFPGTIGARFPFVANGFWGTGAEVVRRGEGGTNVHSPYFWRYSFGTFELKPFLTFRLYKSVGLQLNGELYVFGGQIYDHTPNKIIHQFDELLNSWSSPGSAPVEVSSDYPYFAYNNEAYFVLPDGIWRFNPISGEWGVVGYFPEVVKTGGAAVNINGKVYIGLFTDDRRVFEWDLATDVWKEKINLPGSVKDSNTGFFAYNDKAYFFRSKFNGGQFEPDPHMELWSLNPTLLK